MLTEMDNAGGNVIAGGGPGGYVPGGKVIFQPRTLRSSHEMQIKKNQRSQGISVPFSVALGSVTEVVTGYIGAGESEVVLLEGGEVMGPSELGKVGSGVVFGDDVAVGSVVIVEPSLFVVVTEGGRADAVMELCSDSVAVVTPSEDVVVSAALLVDDPDDNELLEPETVAEASVFVEVDSEEIVLMAVDVMIPPVESVVVTMDAPVDALDGRLETMTDPSVSVNVVAEGAEVSVSVTKLDVAVSPAESVVVPVEGVLDGTVLDPDALADPSAIVELVGAGTEEEAVGAIVEIIVSPAELVVVMIEDVSDGFDGMPVDESD
jgi:hypothetical protein